MTGFIIGTILSVLLSVVLLVIGRNFEEAWEMCCVSFGIVTSFVSFVLLIFAIVFSIEYNGAKYKADIINREFGTNYTQKEIFYASDVIDVIREIDRRRYEVNGDLLK